MTPAAASTAFTSALPLSLLPCCPSAKRTFLTPIRRNIALSARPLRRTTPLCTTDKPDRSEDSDPHDIPQSAVDWNSEWSNFRLSGMQSQAPPGRQPLSAQEKARRNMQAKVQTVTSNMPTRQQLFADWRFWVAIILSLSLFSAFVQSTATGAGYA
ncbi:hypothetical protein BWQ96_05489 [Gracilariopsis chorda]|uniref:Uncharacterized protein n=1 Tax=Gracilariopsis chorda TaxID=448386 RepID=A0A2V3IUD0_9FLOR|nr:hypothetical protein BWQ96_05489 [Gracilariopsis chorda]|eukprot:PXF44730.1 hypothetical protein BWQ96_05489 [Gracilariopsis chorda]